MSMTLSVPVDMPSPKPGRQPVIVSVLWRMAKALASLQLTVVLFSLSMVLVFFGTLAQIDKSNETVKEEYFRSSYVWVPTQLIARFGWKFFEYPKPEVVWDKSFPFPGGWLLGGVMLANLLAAHLIRFKLSWRRSGIFLIHSGVVVLLLGELITGLYAVESRMVLQIGEASSFIDHSSRVELAVTDPETNRTITISQGFLKSKNLISSPDLPFDVQVTEFLKNTDLRPVTGGDDLEGVVRVDGIRYKVVPAGEQSGVKSEREDAAAIRVRFLKKGTSELLSERMLSLWQYPNYSGRQYLAPALEVTDGKTYRVQLRNERSSKPYTVELLNFEHKQYVGTDVAKDFASTVRLRDPETSTEREVRIWMNHPLRHRGETFYQHQVVLNDTGTVLQVVKNPAWLLPYLACGLVGIGMLVHFCLTLAKFTNRFAASQAGKTGQIYKTITEHVSTLTKVFPLAIVAVFTLYSAMMMVPKKETYKEFDLTAFGSIPVLDGGRVKPLDSIARTSMLFISGRSEFEDKDGKMQPAILWMLEVLSAGNRHASPIADFRVFRVDNEQVLIELGLPYRPGSYRYSWNDITDPKVATKFEKAYREAQIKEMKKESGEKVHDEERDLFHGKILELARRLSVYEKLASHNKPTLVPREKGSEEWLTLADIDDGIARVYVPIVRSQMTAKVDEVLIQQGKDPNNLTKEEATRRKEILNQLMVGELNNVIDQERVREYPAAAAFMNILHAYKENKPKGFSEAIGEYRNAIEPLSPGLRDTTNFEMAFNSAAPFIISAFMYVFAGVLMTP